jgi:enamine deaminase RidA (YjgF/YER057c/UK114 family)
MSIKRIAPGPRMSKAVVHHHTVYLAGQVAETAKDEGTQAQTAEILAMIDSLLAEVGTDRTKILSATIWLADMADFPLMNKEWDQWIVAGHTPARATVEARLAAPCYRVEIAVIAAL